MHVATTQKNKLVSTESAVKGINYLCPNCKETVILAGGYTQKSHFRHKVGGDYEDCKSFVKGLVNEVYSKHSKIHNNNILFLNEMTNLVEGYDYTILSYQIEDLNKNKIPFLRFCNLDQNDVKRFDTDKIVEYLKEKDIKYRALMKICNYPSIKE